MFCKNCGKQLPEGTRFCTQCGAQQAVPVYVVNNEPKPSVGIMEATKLFFTRYADFKGRSRRSEYWWATLVIGIIGSILSTALPEIAGLWSLAILIPSIAICVRRLHDIGKSGWWYLINCIPLVGQIIFIVWACKDSTEDNQWGPNPKY